MPDIETECRRPDGRPDLRAVPTFIETTHPQINEGVFMPQLVDLPVFDNEVADSTIARAPEFDQTSGKAWYKKVTMNTGTRYSVVVGQPNKPMSDVAFLFTTALGTRIEDTYNLGIVRDMMEIGIPVIGVGPEENHSISIAETAHNMHAIADETDALAFYSPHKLFGGGDSRGAMTMNGVMAMAEKKDREVVDAYLVDPCLAMPINYTSLKEQRHYARSSVVEVYSFARQIRNMSMTERLEHIRRLKFSPGIIGRTALPLRSGQAGELAMQMDEEQKAHVVLFLGSIANQYKTWDKIYEKFPNITTSLLKGSHVSLLRKDVRHARQDYMADARDRLDDQPALTRVI
ncbi:MAG: hypothetical protein M3P98_01975 [bacterium]|nr:hypothetical protein [bacterium]